MGNGHVRTLLFDVLGTMVDETGSAVAALREVVGHECDDVAIGGLVAAWADAVQRLITEIREGGAPWRPADTLHGIALDTVLSAAGRPVLDESTRRHLALVGHRLRPWPETPAALDALATRFTVIALSNAGIAQLTNLSAGAGLRWHGALSGETVRAYKPDPVMYSAALAMFGLEARETMLVAAHPWDLRAAQRHGLRTAYVARPDAAPPAADDHFDLCVADLDELLTRLTA